MEEKAVVDRLEDGAQAVLLVGEAQVEREVPVRPLLSGIREGSWLRVQFEGDVLVEARLDPDETERAKTRISEKLERLRRQGQCRP